MRESLIHAWMSPDNAMIYVDNIVSAFSKHDLEHAEIYRRNGDAYKARITSVIAPIRALIDTIPSDRRWLVSCEVPLHIWPMTLGSKNSICGQSMQTNRERHSRFVKSLMAFVTTPSLLFFVKARSITTQPGR